ncbi:MAG: class I SAM-dependent methyltransferase [Acidimicrobiia bacterium]|nr:class I SAM-dependent methyltransferase [Acidimicrobiia bacterium]
MSLARRLFAAGYDPLMSAAERGWLGRFRALLLDHARGEVVEVGAGTGANLARYHDVIRVHATEPDAEMRRRMERKLDAAPVPVEVSAAPAEDLPFPDASFDTAVSTLVVCSFRDPARALREIRRVLRPDGQYLFLEHGGATGRRGTGSGGSTRSGATCPPGATSTATRPTSCGTPGSRSSSWSAWSPGPPACSGP